MQDSRLKIEKWSWRTLKVEASSTSHDLLAKGDGWRKARSQRDWSCMEVRQDPGGFPRGARGELGRGQGFKRILGHFGYFFGYVFVDSIIDFNFWPFGAILATFWWSLDHFGSFWEPFWLYLVVFFGRFFQARIVEAVLIFCCFFLLKIFMLFQDLGKSWKTIIPWRIACKNRYFQGGDAAIKR